MGREGEDPGGAAELGRQLHYYFLDSVDLIDRWTIRLYVHHGSPRSIVNEWNGRRDARDSLHDARKVMTSCGCCLSRMNPE